MKAKSKGDYVGLYGRVKLTKAWCEDCHGHFIVQDGELACCGRQVEANPEKYKRESQPEQKRKAPPDKEKKRQLEAQDYKCFYCQRTFDSTVYRKGKPLKLKVNYDHMVPYALTQDNSATNFVASCHVCNGIKTDLCFRTVEDAQSYIQGRWKEKEYTDFLELEEDEDD